MEGSVNSHGSDIYYYDHWCVYTEHVYIII